MNIFMVQNQKTKRWFDGENKPTPHPRVYFKEASAKAVVTRMGKNWEVVEFQLCPPGELDRLQKENEEWKRLQKENEEWKAAFNRHWPEF